MPTPTRLHQLPPQAAAALTTRAARNIVTDLLVSLGLDPLAPFGGLQDQPSLIEHNGKEELGRTFKRLLVRRYGVRGIGRIPAPVWCAPTRREWEQALTDAIGHAASWWQYLGTPWRWACCERPHADHAKWLARNRITTALTHISDTDLLAANPWGLTEQILADDPSGSEAQLAMGAGIPDRHTDFAMHRVILREVYLITGHDTLMVHVADARRRRMAAARHARTEATLAEELFGP